ncbi:ATP-binding protein [Vibrio crassostreae]|nr:ATP-binding protein [Vibrio crassostreae]CAK2568946.1 ATP-binding protein [Vibrio crassostreae]CAK2586061.1 ATP-binding protein [Vibrio crassostreae]CAK2586128.1 ATP-binding protein [Vibrio crassostreae]CAK2589003.1 ATP-binding protein [Vibrio crassostreae]
MSQIYQLEDVFTPTSPAIITYVDRLKDDVNDRLVRALKLPGNQVVIYGHSGAGKSTLLENILFRTYEKQIDTNCDETMTFEAIILDAFDQLKEFYVNEVTNNKKEKVDANAKAEYLVIKGQLSASIENNEGEKKVRALPPQLTSQSLGRLLGESGYCWILEDFHKIEKSEKVKLADMMKVFVNLSKKYKDLKVVALGAVNTAREVVKLNKELRRRVSEIHVELMSDDEIKEIIQKGCDALNIIIDDELQTDIAHHSSGLASICHKLCYIMCSEAYITQTVEEPVAFTYLDLKKALSEYMKDEEDTLLDAFDSALKLDKIEPTLRVLANQDQHGAHIDDLYSWAKENSVRITKKKLESDLPNLIKEEYGELVKLEENSQKYSFLDPFYKSFVLAYFENKDNQLGRRRRSDADMLKLVNSAFKTVLEKYSVDDEDFSGDDEL